jgi:DnaK suppressor protein
MMDLTTRRAGLRDSLVARRREIQDDVQGRLRDGRTDRPRDAGDEAEQSDARLQGDLELALLQMRTETLSRIDAALVRLDRGEYGACFECGEEIAERRLVALPFAVRCRDCEDRREQEVRRARQQAQGVGGFSLLPDSPRF